MGSKQSRLLDEQQNPAAANSKAKAITSNKPDDFTQKDKEQSDGITNVQCMKHTTVPMLVSEPMLDAHPEEDVSMFPAAHPDHIPLHIFSEGGSSSSPGEEEEEFVDFCVKLMPHHHTLFCERRVRTEWWFGGVACVHCMGVICAVCLTHTCTFCDLTTGKSMRCSGKDTRRRRVGGMVQNKLCKGST
jgi:hypothetical protein